MRIHLIRHGEVENPDRVVYGSLAGFTLSDRGRDQAISAGRYLGRFPISQIVASPLERAVDTAALLASTGDIPIDIDDRLTEWKLSDRWAGVRWDDLNKVFPGELEAYLADPTNLPFAPESVADIAARVAAAVSAWVEAADQEVEAADQEVEAADQEVEAADQEVEAADQETDVVFVSHQDPIHAARLLLTGADYADFNSRKPAHCSVITLDRAGTTWPMIEYWTPAQ